MLQASRLHPASRRTVHRLSSGKERGENWGKLRDGKRDMDSEKVREIDTILFMPAVCLYTEGYCTLGKEVGGRQKGRASHLGSYWGLQSSCLCNW